MKRCSTCKIQKPLYEFYNDCTQRDGRTRRCKECSKAASRKWRESDRGRAREKWRNASKRYSRGIALSVKYGLTVEDYDRIFAAQSGKCAICDIPAEDAKGRNPGRLCVDHDHDTGVVRGLLCSPCNAALGSFGDDLDILRKVVEYLERACMDVVPLLESRSLQGGAVW